MANIVSVNRLTTTPKALHAVHGKIPTMQARRWIAYNQPREKQPRRGGAESRVAIASR
ncbi:MAG: hypothetical protein JOZ49_10490 [Mycolicibacterium sp.]|nr:hypothetical protein [Mycolicibacterium sp.]